ncbi:MAG TPA: glycosyltransferase family 2 protein [Allosphingosinicella sp.]
MTGLVSVVMPVLNGAEWLAEATESILAQTHRDLELIVVDDGSDDSSRDIAAAAAERDPRVRTLFLERNPLGTSSARAANAGIALARGRYIARMDCDDIALPDRLSRQIEFLEAEGLDGCGGRAQAFGADEGVFRYSDTPAGMERELVFRVCLLHPTLLTRAELMHAFPYLESASHEDYEWLTRVAAGGGRLGNLPEIVLRRRTHAEQANVRHRELFMRDLRRYRFLHVMRLFPRTRPAEFQALAALAERTLRGPEELEAAAAWLVRLADIPDSGLRHLLLVRWREACDGLAVPAGDPFRERIARQVAGGEG